MKYIKLFYDWLESTCTLAEDERGRLIDAMVLYARDGVTPELPGNERFVFPIFRLQLDRDRECYTRVGKSREDYARSREDQAKEKDEDEDQDNDQDEFRERNNHWRTSGRARGATAQLLVDSCISENLPCAKAANLHDEFVRAMEQGLEPGVILDCCRRSGDVDLGYALYAEMKQRRLNPA